MDIEISAILVTFYHTREEGKNIYNLLLMGPEVQKDLYTLICSGHSTISLMSLLRFNVHQLGLINWPKS